MTKVDTRTDHKPILPASLGERDLRSLVNSFTKAMRRTKNGAMILKLRAEQKQLQTQLQEVIELKRRKLEARLAEIEATNGPEASS